MASLYAQAMLRAVVKGLYRGSSMSPGTYNKWLYFPASGWCNNSDGSLNNVGSNGYYWSAGPNNQNNGWNLNFNSSNVNPLNNNNRSNGFSVRPAQEFIPAGAGNPLIKNSDMMEDNGQQLLTDLFKAYYDARRKKRNTGSQLAFEIDLEHNMIELYNQIRDRSYHPSPGVCFVVERPVKREIFASNFRDRVVHHLLYNYLSPLFDPGMIFDSYSCRKGKGTSMGISRLEHHIRSCTQNYRYSAYILKLDLRGYFMSIRKERLYEIVCKRLQKYGEAQKTEEWPGMELIDFLLRQIIFRDPVQDCRIRGRPEDWDGLPPNKSLLHAPDGVGLPIGDLTSQLFSNIYLGELDNYVKRVLRCKHFGRYVDDFFIVHPSKCHLKELIPWIRDFLSTELQLELHPDKIELQHYSRGISFLGAYVKPYRKYPSKRSVGFFFEAMHWLETECTGKIPSPKKLKKMLSVINSYMGYMRQFRAHNLVEGRLANSPLNEYFYFTDGYRKAGIRSASLPSARDVPPPPFPSLQEPPPFPIPEKD